MTGTIKNIMRDRNFGFIKNGRDEYFFHAEDCLSPFNEMKFDYLNGMQVDVEFESVPSNKGLRAGSVKRIFEPRTAAGSLD